MFVVLHTMTFPLFDFESEMRLLVEMMYEEKMASKPEHRWARSK